MMGPPRSRQQRRELAPEPRQPARRRARELLVRAAQHQRRIGEEPGRIAAQLPLGAHVGTRPDDDVQPFGGGGAHERRDVVIAAEVESPRRRLVEVPEDVGRDGVQSHRPRHSEAIAPVLARDARIMHLARQDLQRLAVEQELTRAGDETRGRRLRAT